MFDDDFFVLQVNMVGVDLVVRVFIIGFWFILNVNLRCNILFFVRIVFENFRKYVSFKIFLIQIYIEINICQNVKYFMYFMFGIK